MPKNLAGAKVLRSECLRISLEKLEDRTFDVDESKNDTLEYYYKIVSLMTIFQVPFTVGLIEPNFIAVEIMSIINVALSLLTLRCLFP